MKADVNSGVQERPAFCGGCTESKVFKDFVHTLLLEYEYVELVHHVRAELPLSDAISLALLHVARHVVCTRQAEGHILNLVLFVFSAR